MQTSPSQNGRFVFLALTIGLIGLAVGSFFVARALTGGSGSVAADSAATTFPEPPGPDVTPIPGTTPDTSSAWWYVPYLNAEQNKAPLDGTIAGIRIGPDVDLGRGCPAGLKLGAIDDTSGTQFDLALAAHPPKTTLIPGSEYVVLCDGQVVASEASYSVGADTTGAPFGGHFQVSRYGGEPYASVSIAANRWTESKIGGVPAALAEPILADAGLGQGAVVQYRDGVNTKVTSWGIPLDQLLRIAEGLMQ